MEEIKYNKISDIKSKLLYIEGMRGIAAIMVVFCHWSCVFASDYYYITENSTSFEKFWINSPLNIINNGNAPVQFFFLISAYLSARNISVGKGCIADGFKYICRKYIRLIQVVLPGILFAYFLLKYAFMFHIKAYQLYSKLVFVTDYYDFQPGLANLVADFFNTFIQGSIYVGPFWTIRFELLGVLIITVINSYAYATCQSNVKKVLLLILFYIPVFYFNEQLSIFVLGTLFYYVEAVLEENKKLRVHFVGWLFVLILGIYLASINRWWTGIWSWIKNIFPHQSTIRAMGIGLCLISIRKISLLKHILSNKYFVWLGKISPFIYAFHWPIILSLGCFLFVCGYTNMGYIELTVGILCICLLATIVVSCVYIKIFSGISCCFQKK